MIKVLQERSRREQARPELAGLRPARSVPSINTVTTTTIAQSKGEMVIGYQARLRKALSIHYPDNWELL